jgi:hypothetical protein
MFYFRPGHETIAVYKENPHAVDPGERGKVGEGSDGVNKTADRSN